MTLNGVITVILRISPNSVALRANYVKVVEARAILSAKCSPNNVLSSTVWYLQWRRYTRARQVKWLAGRSYCFLR